jgi:hypothetical protein
LVLAFAVAAGEGAGVIGGWAGSGDVFFSAVSACPWLSAHRCNMAIPAAFIALGHFALTMEEFAVFQLVVLR